MDLYCQHCGEPWDFFSVTDEMTPIEKRTFDCGKGCPSCYKLDDGAEHPAQGHYIKEVEEIPFRAQLQAEMRAILGDDVDGLASMMDDAQFMMGDKFWE